MTSALETRLAALETRLNPGAAGQKARQQEVADAGDAFGLAFSRRRPIAKNYIATIGKLREGLEALRPLTAAVAQLVEDDREAWNDQRGAVDRGATGDIDPRLPASIEPWEINKLLKALDDSLAVARKQGAQDR